MNVALIQQSWTGDSSTAIKDSLEKIGLAASEGADLVVLQELHAGPYFCSEEHVDRFSNAEPIPGPLSEKLASCAKKNSVVLVGSLFEKRAAGLYHNTAVVFERDGSIAGIYRKMHIPDDPGYYEKFYFTPGDVGFEPIKTSVGNLGVLVCWDQWFPEAARLMTLAGADCLIYPTAIGWDPMDAEDEQTRQADAWEIVQRGHAVANGLPLIAVNRVGRELDPDTQRQQVFWGRSFVCGPQGEILLRCGAESGVFLCEVPTERTETVRKWWPFLRDRRIDAYGDILKRWRD